MRTMSATYSSTSVPYEPGSAVNALCLSLSSARKRCSPQEREPTKKRRKQLNPVRLSLEAIEDASSAPPPLQPYYETADLRADTISDKQNTTTYPSRYAHSLTDATISEPSLTCRAVPKQTFRTLPAEIDSRESTTSSPSESGDDAADSLPLNLTKNARLASPTPSPRRAKSESPDDKKDVCVSPSRPLQPAAAVMVMPNLFTGAVNRSSSTTCRIFNPEAFCNICNKEFCNKYFLKTHKANKHGVYCEGKEASNANDNELPAVPLMFSWNLKNHANTLKTAVAMATSAAAAASTTAVSNVYAVKDSSAFCNVCEKEFCNKYFLRRHKEKMHGIVPANEPKGKGGSGGGGSGGDQGSEKSEEDERSTLAEDVKYTSPQLDRISELNFSAKFDKAKLTKLPMSSADSVSDFIRLCLGGGGKILKERDKLTNGDIVLIDEKRSRDEFVDLNKHISKFAAEHEQRLRLEASKATGSGNESSIAHPDHPHERVGADSSSTCEHCKKTLSTRAVLKLHQKYVHAISSDEDKEDGDFRHVENVYFMILKFSWLNTTVTFCEICQTDFEKNDLLEMHLMNTHGRLVDELSRIIEDAGVNGLSAPSLTIADGSILCQICSKTFPTNAAFQQHVYEKCAYSDVGSEFYGGGGGAGGAEDADSSKSTRNFCEICKKELCNKYFMKTHMRRMHGISLQNGVRIGGVTCEICNKELCSKYFLRVHKKNCHGITERASISRFMVSGGSGGDSERLDVNQSCTVCGRVFKSVKWLKTHLFNDHGKLGAGVWQDFSTTFSSGDAATNEFGANELSAVVEMSSQSNESEEKRLPTSVQLYDCSRCPFRLTSVEALMAHQRLHAKSSDDPPLQYQCTHCFIVTKDKFSLEEHVAYHHYNSSDFHEKIELAAHLQVASDMETIEKKNNVYRVPNAS